MKILNVKLADKEVKALQELLWNRYSCCRSGCVWEECEKAASKIKNEEKRYRYCDKCSFTRSVNSLEKKLNLEEEKC